jgi:cytochrome c oxidase subunit IV
MAEKEGGHQEHPLGIYYLFWFLLFVLSAGSYASDFLEHGPFRTGLILLFMMLKAAGIVYIFMHMWWERLALKIAILGPPVAIMVLIWLMAEESIYVEDTRIERFGESTMELQSPDH